MMKAICDKMDIREVLDLIPSITDKRVVSFSCKVDGWLVRYGNFKFEDGSEMCIRGNGMLIEFRRKGE